MCECHDGSSVSRGRGGSATDLVDIVSVGFPEAADHVLCVTLCTSHVRRQFLSEVQRPRLQRPRGESTAREGHGASE